MVIKAAALSSLLTACFLLVADAKVYNTKVAILGGGVSGISAALNLTAAGVTDFMMIEARDILGGRAQDAPFANINVELGCNWVQGLGTNPINQMALKYKLKTAPSYSDDVVWYGENGKYNGTAIYNKLNDHYDTLLDIACNVL
jgi:polyamine oxidase